MSTPGEPTDLKKVACPECGRSNIQALLRGTAYATHAVRGLKGGVLMLAATSDQEWAESWDEMDEELKCLDCGAFPQLMDLGLEQDQYDFEKQPAKG